MAFNPTEVANPALNLILNEDDKAFYTDASGNVVPIMVAVVPTASNTLNSFQGAGVISSSNLEVHPASAIDKMSRPPFFVSTGGQKVPVMALVGFDGAGNLQPLSSAQATTLGNFATGGSIGTAATTVDIANFVFVAQTTAAQTLTLPSPTDATLVRTLYVGNTGSASFSLLGQTVAAGAALLALWSGSAWLYVA